MNQVFRFHSSPAQTPLWKADAFSLRILHLAVGFWCMIYWGELLKVKQQRTETEKLASVNL